MKDIFSVRIAKRSFRCLCVVLTALVLCGMPFLAKERASAAEQTTQSLAELQEQYQKIEKELKENEKRLNQVSKQKNEQQKVVNTIYQQIDETRKQIDLLSSRIDLLNADLDNTNKQIAVINGQIKTLNHQIETTQTAVTEKQLALQDTYAKLRARVRAIYMAGTGSTLEFLLSSQDFSTLLSRSELLVRVAQHDNSLMETIESDIGELQMLEASLNDSKEQVQSKKAELDSKKAALDGTSQELQVSNTQLLAKQKEIQTQYGEAQRELNSLDKKSAEYAAIVRQQEKELERANREIEERVRQTGSKTTDAGSSGKMIFPLKCSGVRISSAYGYRKHPTTGTKNSFHKGTDFSAPNIYQKPIYAVRDGSVHMLVSNNYWYGNYIVIDHGDGVSSMYAHCDSTCVKQGAKVKQGQVIGYVGSTGQSTGPHLHFGVLVNGNYVDPMKGYLTLPK